MNRQEANREIVRRISEMVESQPDLRFHQVLNSLGVTNRELVLDKVFIPDLIQEESEETLKRMNGNGR